MYHFIVNPFSRSGRTLFTWTLLRQELELRNIHYVASMTRYTGHATILAREASSQGSADAPVYIIAVGGDGTVQEVLTGITDLSNVVFGYIPTGSGNDFGRGLGIPHSPSAALNVILNRNKIGSLDVPVINEGGRISRFGVSAGIGFDAAVCQNAAVSPLKKYLNRFRLGKLAYAFVALKQFLLHSPSSMDFSIDNAAPIHYEKVYFAAIMNQKYEGGGFPFCPDADPLDGFLDIIIAEGVSRLNFVLLFAAVFFKRHTHLKGIHIFRCQNIKIHSSAPQIVHKDGEAKFIENDFSVFLERKPLKVILPVL